MPASKPNLLFIYTDQQSAATMAAYGNRLIETPNLDRLAGESVLFERAYVTQPVCTPSRASLLTGLYPHASGCVQNNIPLRRDIPCLPEMLPDGEFATGHFGKWHLGDELFAQHGFREWVSTENSYNRFFSAGRDREKRPDYDEFLLERGFRPAAGDRFGRTEAARMPEEYGKPAFLADRARDFMRRHRRDRFALFVNFLEPHTPYTGPRDGMYRPEDIPLPPGFNYPPGPGQHPRTRLLADWIARKIEREEAGRDERDRWRRIIARYWGLCSLVDTHVGRILDALAENGLEGNTVVVFTSDHGDMMGAHRLLYKTVMYEEAVRVPFLVRLPGRAGAGRRIREPVSQVDAVPTLLELLGGQGTGRLQGHSLVPRISGGKEPGKPVFIEWTAFPERERRILPGPGETPGLPEEIAALDGEELDAVLADPVRTVVMPEGWKLSFSRVGRHELYDLSADPLETRNVAAENPGLVKRLSGLIERWREETGDGGRA